MKGEDSGGGKHTFVEVVMRSGMVHDTHYKCLGPWRRSGVGVLDSFITTRGKVTGDLVPIGDYQSRGGGCLFLWRSVVLGRLAGKWLRNSGMWLVRFPQIVPSHRFPMMGLGRRWNLVRLLRSSVWICHDGIFFPSNYLLHHRLSYFVRSSVM